MRLSKIKTKEIRYVVWKYRLKRFLPHILTLCLAVIVAGGAFSAYSVYHKKHQKQLAKQSEIQREKDVNTARKKAQKEKTTLKPWYTYHSIAHAMGGLDGKDYLNSIDGFYPAYQKGYRVFEMDILLTKDNVAIGKHQWGRKLSDPTSKKGDPVSYRKFKNTKIYGKYTPTSFLDVLNLMEKYPDFYLMTDSKSTEPADAKKVEQDPVVASIDMPMNDEIQQVNGVSKSTNKETRRCDRSGLQSENVLGCKKRASIQAFCIHHLQTARCSILESRKVL